MKKFNNRGLSDVITTVLIILLVLAGVMIIWVFVYPFLTNTGEQINIDALTAKVDIVRNSVQLEENGNISFVVKYNRGESDIEGVFVILEDEKGNTKRIQRNFSLNILETKRINTNYLEHNLQSLSSISVYPFFISDKGEIVTGSLEGNIKVSRVFTDYNFTEAKKTPYEGIYVLGRGDRVDVSQRLNRIYNLDKDFVDGYAWRMEWIDFDKGVVGPVYNFDLDNYGVDDAVSQVQAKGENKKLSIHINANKVPIYVNNSAQNDNMLHSIRDPGLSVGTDVYIGTPLPWHEESQESFREFMKNLSEYRVFDTAIGERVMLKDHSTLSTIMIGLLGIGKIRDIDVGRITHDTRYTRELFVQSTIENIHAVQDAFPNKKVIIPYFSLSDDGQTVEEGSLNEELITRISNEFDGVKNPKVLFFQELLRGDAPKIDVPYGQTLLRAKGLGLPIAFQACGSWRLHSLCNYTIGDDVPENGFRHGNNTFGAKYYEIYDEDLNYGIWEEMFQNWSDYLTGR